MFHHCKNLRLQHFVYLGLFLLALFQISYLVHLYPNCSDDYAYMHITGTSSPVQNLSDIIISQLHHYTHVNGRFAVHAFLQLFLILGKPAFNIFLTLCYALCVFLIAHLSRANFSRACAFVALSLWILVPLPGQTIFWECGAFNYIIATCIGLIFIELFLADKKALQFLSLPLAFLVGNSHEGLSAGIWVALALFCILERKHSFSGLRAIALALLLLGFLSNILSPGTQLRINSFASENQTGFVATHLINICKSVQAYIHCLMAGKAEIWLITLLVICGAVLHYLHFRRNKTLSPLAFGLFAGSLANFALTLAANALYERAFFGTGILALISSYLMLLPILQKRSRLSGVLFALLLPLSFTSFFLASVQIKALRDKEECLIKQIKEQQSVLFAPETSANLHGRFVEWWGNSNNYTQNNLRSLYYGGQRYHSVIENTREKELIQSFDFSRCSEQRVFRLAPDAVLIRLKKRHKSERAVYLAPKQPSRLATLLGHESQEASATIQKHIPCAAFVQDGAFYLLLISPAPEINLDILYADGEEESLRITSV